MISIPNVPIKFANSLKPAHIQTYTTEDSYFEINLKITLSSNTENGMVIKDGDYLADISIQDVNYDLTNLPVQSVAIPVVLGHISKAGVTTFNFTSAIPNYDQMDFRRPLITKLNLNVTPDFMGDMETLVILNTYLVIIDLTNVKVS